MFRVRPRVAVLTLGTNHVYIPGDGRDSGQLPEAPAAPLRRAELSVDECAGYLQKAINLLKSQTAASGSSEGTLR